MQVHSLNQAWRVTGHHFSPDFDTQGLLASRSVNVSLFLPFSIFSLLKMLYHLCGFYSPTLMKSRIIMWLQPMKSGPSNTCHSRKKREAPLHHLPCLLSLFCGQALSPRSLCVCLGLDWGWQEAELQPGHAGHQAWERSKCLFLEATESWVMLVNAAYLSLSWLIKKGHRSIWQRCSWLRKVYPHSSGEEKLKILSWMLDVPWRHIGISNGTHSGIYLGVALVEGNPFWWAFCLSNMKSILLVMEAR